MARDYYDVLGVQRDADHESIKRAYRARSRSLHPDVSGEAHADAGFRELAEAYAVLSRPEARRLYDRFGWRGRGRGFERRPGRVYHAGKRALLHDLETLFAAATGGRAARQVDEVVGSLELDAYEARIGVTRRVEVGEERPCAECGGSGRRKTVADRESGRFLSLDDCAECSGSGVAEERCAVEVPVPPRVRDLDRVPVGPDQVAIVRIVPARERIAVQAAAAGGLLTALGFLVFLLSV
jgi:molecular chaperone DnaJ